MNHVQSILATHPLRAQFPPIPGLESLLLALQDCAFSCSACADACSSEPEAHHLRRCIRQNLDCVDACVATAMMFTRVSDPDWRVLRAQLQACLSACVACAEQCERHAGQHAHCRVCAEACRACERACQAALGRVPALEMT